MRKFRITMGATALAIVAAIIIACTKEKETIVSQNASETITISKEDDMSAYLKQFKEKMQSEAKGNEILSMEEARWHLEAVLNYTYGDAGRQITDVQYDTLHYTIRVDGNKVSLAQLNEAFEELSHGVEKAFDKCVLPDKSVLAIQSIFENKYRSGDVDVRCVLYIRGLNAAVFCPVFDSTDYWWEDDCSGKCGPYEGDCIGEGAVQQLQSKINSNMAYAACATGHGYFTDYSNVVIFDYVASGLTDPNSPYGYRVPFFYSDVNEYTCLSPEDLNYYLSEALKLINEFRPDNYVPVCMANEYMYAVPIGYHLAYHEYTFTYGAYHCFSGDDY